MLEEVGAYQYKKNKEYERDTSGDSQVGLRPEFEEDFSFGEEDDTDYLNFKLGWFDLLVEEGDMDSNPLRSME